MENASCNRRGYEKRVAMYDVKSSKAEEFICDAEIKETIKQAAALATDKEYIKGIIEKARACKGITHREAAVLLECNDPELLEELYALAREIKNKFYGNRIVPFCHKRGPRSPQ